MKITISLQTREIEGNRFVCEFFQHEDEQITEHKTTFDHDNPSDAIRAALRLAGDVWLPENQVKPVVKGKNDPLKDIEFN